MSTLALSRYALSASVVALLPGCGGSQPPIGTPGAMRQSRAIATHAPRGGSWMLPEARVDDLLYVSNTHTVTIYSYPKGRLEGTIRFGYLPGGECVDSTGDIFVTNLDTGQIFEYAHGENKPLKVLRSPGADPLGCSVDPTTGNLAVSSLGFGSSGSIGIYKHARGTPKIYQDTAFQQYWYCGYDAAGNLYVDGQNASSTFEFAELPRGRHHLKSIALNQSIGWPGGVRWDGKYVVVGDQNIAVVYQFVIKGNTGAKAGSTSLGGSDVSGVGDFDILGSRLIAPNHCTGSCTGNVLFYRYPAGGLPTKTIAKGVRYPVGLAVSEAPK
jgi:hypothetical protein